MSLFDVIITSCTTAFGIQIKPYINMVSGTVFFILAWILWNNYLKTSKKRDEERVALILLMIFIGTGSMMLHISNINLGKIFINLGIALIYPFCLYVLLRRLIGMAFVKTLCLVVAFGAAHASAFLLPKAITKEIIFIESIVYITFPLAVGIIAFFLQNRKHEAARNCILSTFLMLLGIIAHAADQYLCTFLPTGSIFIWQICFACGFYLLCSTIKERRHAVRNSENDNLPKHK